jgi:hypothetical protein
MAIHEQEAFRTPDRQNQKRTMTYHIRAKMSIVPNKEQIMKTARQRCQVIYKDKPI